MPMTINGIGTHYWGNRNRRTYQGVCDTCKNQTHLNDYETSLFFVVLFIPLIPLGKKQIIGECSSCQQHRVMPLHQWQETSERAVDEGMADLADAMENPDKALELLGTMNFFNRTEEAHELAAATQRTFHDNIDVQFALGGYYEGEGMVAEANACFDRAIQIDPAHPNSIRAAAFDLMDAGKHREAAKKLDGIRPPSEAYDAIVFFRLAMGMTATGDHEAAMVEYQQLCESTPELTKDKSFRKEVQKSEKALGRPGSILPKLGWFG